jgi:pimeloyl-ACP methyl ester carboxylesterase
MGPYADEVLDKMITPANVRALPAVAGHVLRMMRGTSPEGAAAALRGRAERPDYLESLSRAAVPVLVVVGAEDEYTPVDAARRVHAAVPGAALAVVEGAGHLPNLERPEEFTGVVARFLADLGPLG